VRLPFAHLWTLRNGRVVRMDAYSDQQRALEAVGFAG
jgi:ketosteroid isomerase-like protein